MRHLLSNTLHSPLFPIVLQLGQLHSCRNHVESKSSRIQECYILPLMDTRAWSMVKRAVSSQNRYNRNSGLKGEPDLGKNK